MEGRTVTFEINWARKVGRKEIWVRECRSGERDENVKYFKLGKEGRDGREEGRILPGREGMEGRTVNL